MTSKVNILNLVLSFFLIILLSCGLGFAASDQEFYPFLGEVTEDRVNVRAGSSANFESLALLNKSNEVIVLGRSYSWYKIQIPADAKSYISSEFVVPLGKIYGLVSGDRINIRAGSGVNHSVLGQLNKGDKVRILEKLDGWYRIAPIKGSAGWVMDDFLVFKSKHIPEYLDIKAIEVTESLADEIDKDSRKKESSFRDRDKEKKVPERIVLNGYLKPVLVTSRNDVAYQLVINDQPIYYLKAKKSILSPFDAYKVTVEGSVDEDAQGSLSLPVLDLTHIQIVQ